ncbi:hypothetical protein Tco_1427213 [Tanacetum coccineum]
MCLESWGRISYARILIAINACNDFNDNLIMAVPNIEATGYTKETIHVEYKWQPPRCSTCLLFGHSFDDCTKIAPKRVENLMDKGKGQILRVDDEGFIEVRQKKLGGNYGGNKHFKSVSLNPKTQYQPKANIWTEGTCNYSKMDPPTGTNKASTSVYNKIERINVLEKQILEDKLVLVDEDGKPLEKVDYPDNSNSDDEVEHVENETASFFGIKESWIWSEKPVETMKGYIGG